jgi:hypothetical protein
MRLPAKNESAKMPFWEQDPFLDFGKKGAQNRLKLWEMPFYVKLRLDFFGESRVFFGRVTIVGKTRKVDNPNIRYNQNFVVFAPRDFKLKL